MSRMNIIAAMAGLLVLTAGCASDLTDPGITLPDRVGGPGASDVTVDLEFRGPDSASYFQWVVAAPYAAAPGELVELWFGTEPGGDTEFLAHYAGAELPVEVSPEGDGYIVFTAEGGSSELLLRASRGGHSEEVAVRLGVLDH